MDKSKLRFDGPKRGRATKLTRPCDGCEDPFVRRSDQRRCEKCTRLFCRMCLDEKADICLECGGPRPPDRGKYQDPYVRAHDEYLAQARRVV